MSLWCKESTWSVAQRMGVIRGSGHVGTVRGLRSRMRTKRKWSWAQSEEILQNESPYDSATFSWYMWWTNMNIYIYIIYIYIYIKSYSYSHIYIYVSLYVSNIIHIVHILILLLNFYFWIPFWNCHFALSFRSLSGCNRGCQRTDPTHPHGQGTETSDTWSSSPSLLNLESGMLPLNFQQISHNFQGLVIVDLLLPWFPCFIYEFSGCLCCRTGATPRHHKNFEEPPGAK